ncbi:hypothetical protein BLNAU_9989 [Blattamonas nauphoetae]|uniref:NHR domain-containing protein n=1 Tax=Blattamonas nauphoetae TaxID=2049346 RepID=A0ABQ9XUA8_9EUKA|nr:hypothetical protein BLNAU_23028 [Blattamonas nauphoetae]KAK2955058.1 hypothetical protein BLNAU_9989 [Blattamonas nauphoetae]
MASLRWVMPSSVFTGIVRIGVLDTTSPIPEVGESIGTFCHSKLKEGDCVRMEVEMDSNPRTLQFFVNGESGRCFVSGLPRSVRIGFSVFGQGTSFRIDRIAEQQRPTPIAPDMREFVW